MAGQAGAPWIAGFNQPTWRWESGMTDAKIIGTAASIVLVAGPLLLGLAGWVHVRREQYDVRPGLSAPGNWRLTIASALLYVLAFNLTFFIQELFLVLPKALTPGLRPTLFHNNHSWQGTSPLASLFQGTGVLATIFSGGSCWLLVQRLKPTSTTARLFLLWMAYCGLFMALPQVVIGAISPQSDVGMAMHYLHLGSTTKLIMALAALGVVPWLAQWLGSRFLTVAGDTGQVASARDRNRFIFRAATLPALIAIPMIIPFRVPRMWIEVVAVPVVVTLIGIAWIQAGAWRMRATSSVSRRSPGSLTWLLAAVCLLLLVFQFLLRPGVRFY